jgi:hypothetical protein
MEKQNQSSTQDLWNLNAKNLNKSTFKNDICTFYTNVGSNLGLEKTRKELYEEVSRILLKYNK